MVLASSSLCVAFYPNYELIGIKWFAGYIIKKILRSPHVLGSNCVFTLALDAHRSCWLPWILFFSSHQSLLLPRLLKPLWRFSVLAFALPLYRAFVAFLNIRVPFISAILIGAVW